MDEQDARLEPEDRERAHVREPGELQAAREAAREVVREAREARDAARDAREAVQDARHAVRDSQEPARDGGRGEEAGQQRGDTPTAELLEAAAWLYERTQAVGVLVISDPLPDLDGLRHVVAEGKLVVACRRPDQCRKLATWAGARVLELPDVRLGRSDQIKLAILTGLTTGALPREGRLVALVGRYGSAVLDTMMIVDVQLESELLQAAATADVSRIACPAVFHAVLRLAVEIAHQGREGKKIGTLFVLGDHERVLALSRPLIFNPFQGYPEEERNICNPTLWETMKEFAALDGAFLIRDDGVVIAAGRYLNAALPDDQTISLGLGSRHAAAAGITSIATGAIAIVVSQSNGTVRVYKGGKAILEIERPA
jgi:DNA integrity scanning protein DisA with diadenylate cyclase activity